MKLGLVGLSVLLAVCASLAHGGVYWGLGVRISPVSVCFVGNALVARPDRVAQILDYMHDIELAANVRYDYLGTCAASIPQPNGDDWFGGDIRIVIPDTDVNAQGPVPGGGCPMFGGVGNYDGGNDGWGSWSNPPDDLEPHRSCLYNLKLGDDPWNATPYRNHTLHEVGHALGLSHEHQRADATCPGSGTITYGYLTPYDIASVMSYHFPACGALGNYADTGLSDRDKLSVRILYPESGFPAQIVGRRTVELGESVNLAFGWRAEGAHMPFVASSVAWSIDGTPAGTAVDFQHVFASAGEYLVGIEVVDFLGRTHDSSIVVRVLTRQQFQALMAAMTAINASLSLGQEFSLFYDGFGGYVE